MGNTCQSCPKHMVSKVGMRILRVHYRQKFKAPSMKPNAGFLAKFANRRVQRRLAFLAASSWHTVFARFNVFWMGIWPQKKQKSFPNFQKHAGHEKFRLKSMRFCQINHDGGILLKELTLAEKAKYFSAEIFCFFG